jgi:Tol biopolymer transport system component
LLSTRSREFKSGVIFVDGEKVKRIGAKFGYASWHPGGKMVAFADMKVHQFFHTARPEIRDVIDMASCIAVFDVEQEKMRRIPDLIGANSLETYPSWAPDGKTLYFCSAKRPWGDSAQVPPPGYDRVRYSLCRISFDGKTRSWHSPEVVLSAEQTGRSMVLPRISPDGRLLLFCMCDYGVFPVFQKSSDLYCLNLATGEYRPIEGNSGESESWHSWSSNGRWIAFSSKRDDGVFTRIYLAHIDENGTVSKPFVLPQKDPLLYESQCITYSVPEFITGPIRAGGFAIGAAARQGTVAAVDAVTSSTPR